METRTSHFGAALDVFRRRYRTSRSARLRKEETRQRFQPQEIQRPGDFLRQPACEIRAGVDGAVGRFCELRMLSGLTQTPTTNARHYLRRRALVSLGLELERVAEVLFVLDNFTSSSRLNVRRRFVPTSRNSTSYQPFIRST